MSIADYFPVANKNASEVVPQIYGATSREKEEVTKQLKRLEEKPKGRGKYKTWTVAEKVEIGNYAIQYSVAAAVRAFSKKYPNLSKQSASDFKKVCLYFFWNNVNACMSISHYVFYRFVCTELTASILLYHFLLGCKRKQARKAQGGSPSFKRSTSNGCSYQQRRKGHHRS